MAFGISISDFRTQIKDLARPNRFKIEINPPSGIPTGMFEDFQDIAFFARNASIPERTVNEHTIKKYGMMYHVAADMDFSDLTITFLNDYEWKCRTFFEVWIDKIARAKDNKRLEPSEYLYQSRLRVFQLGRTQNDILAKYEFHDIYPKTVGRIELSMDNRSEVETFDVTFVYTYWVRIDDQWKKFGGE